METQPKDTSSLWKLLLDKALSCKELKVNRDEFLIAAFAPYGTSEQAESLAYKRPIDVYNREILNRVADDIVREHASNVFASFAAMDVFWPLICSIIPITKDWAQFYWQMIVVAQKLAYIYGWPDLSDDEGELKEDAERMLTLFIGTAYEVYDAPPALSEVAIMAAMRWTKKLPAMPLMNMALDPVVKRVGEQLSAKIPNDKTVVTEIPIIGSIISKKLFQQKVNRLKKELMYAVFPDTKPKVYIEAMTTSEPSVSLEIDKLA